MNGTIERRPKNRLLALLLVTCDNCYSKGRLHDFQAVHNVVSRQTKVNFTFSRVSSGLLPFNMHKLHTCLIIFQDPFILIIRLSFSV